MVKLILKIWKNPKRIQLLLGTAAILKNTLRALIVTGRLQNPRGASRKQHVFLPPALPEAVLAGHQMAKEMAAFQISQLQHQNWRTQTGQLHV